MEYGIGLESNTDVVYKVSQVDHAFKSESQTLDQKKAGIAMTTESNLKHCTVKENMG